MLEQPMINKMLAMRLHGMAEALKAQDQDANIRELSFLERLGLLVDQQWNWRENQALARRLKNAKLRGNPCVEDIDYRAARGLDKSIMRALTQESGWVKNHENIFVLGPTGVGKSFIASALAQKACRDGYTVHYARVPRLFADLDLAHGDGRFARLFRTLVKIDLLVLDDFGPDRLNASQRRDLMEIIEDRHGRRSTLITSQLPVDKWHEVIGEPTFADAILDRIVHNAYRLKLDGPSIRKTKAAIP